MQPSIGVTRGVSHDILTCDGKSGHQSPMPRQVRIEFVGAFYHVMARGIGASRSCGTRRIAELFFEHWERRVNGRGLEFTPTF